MGPRPHCAPETAADGPRSVAPSGRDKTAVSLRIREIRTQRRMSQRQVAARMAVPRTYISKVENGRAMPTLTSLERLATALSVHLCDLVQDKQAQRQQEIAALMADPFLSEVSTYAARMNALQRSLVLHHLQEMATGRRRSA